MNIKIQATILNYDEYARFGITALAYEVGHHSVGGSVFYEAHPAYWVDQKTAAEMVRSSAGKVTVIPVNDGATAAHAFRRWWEFKEYCKNEMRRASDI